MTSRKQIEANRRNAQRSTGPTTPEGKAASSANATRHGILSNRFVAAHEDRALFFDLRSQLMVEFEPATPLGAMLVERLAILFWRERRLAAAEAEQIESQYAESTDTYFPGAASHPPLMDQYLVGRYQGLLARQIRDTLRDLREERERYLQTIEFLGGHSVSAAGPDE